MKSSLNKIIKGYNAFRAKYAEGANSDMQLLADKGQKPEVMVIACCDSRVDPALILQCNPGELFTVRNVANIVPPYENDEFHHGTSAALEFGICYLNVKHLIILGHSLCGGIDALINRAKLEQNDFISHWVSLVESKNADTDNKDLYAELALNKSYQNCLTFPWIKDRVDANKLTIHQWFFNIKDGQIMAYVPSLDKYVKLQDAVEYSELV